MTSGGINHTGTILDKIITHKRREVAASMLRVSPVDIQAAIADVPPPKDFIGALRQSENVALIAEVKHASPSKGVLIQNFDPVAIAQFYDANGAAAISVLTDEKFFQGHLDHLKAIRAQVDVPLLRKEFIIDSYQVHEARAAGADAVLLIVAALEDSLLAELHDLITELGMAALVEVHNEQEMERALRLNPRLIGVNNRDLHNFSVDLGTTRRLAAMAPSGIRIVGESGIRTAADVQELGAVDAILVGETLITASARVAAIRELTQIPKLEKTR